MGVTREYAEHAIETFNKYFDNSNQEIRNHFGNRRASIEDYLICHLCGGNYKNFRDKVDNDCPDGVTIGPILLWDEK